MVIFFLALGFLTFAGMALAALEDGKPLLALLFGFIAFVLLLAVL